MIKSRLYLQICLVFVGSLVGFALLASLVWLSMGVDDYEQDLFRKSGALAEMLIPGPSLGPDEQTATLEEIHRTLDVDVSLYDSNGVLVAYAGPEIVLPSIEDTLEPGGWTQAKGGTEWTTKLTDGRYLMINLDRIALPGEVGVFVLFQVAIALGIAVVMYPFIRGLTRRLERLQLGVRKIGFGHLNARVEVEGHDEIAKLAQSFNNAAEKIQALVQSQKMLLANTSHELRTPLARIRMGVEMLSKGDSAERRAALQSDVGELDDLIDELILMTKTDTVSSKTDFEPFDLMALVAEECARYPDCVFAGPSIEVDGDRRMIQHALRNLLDNAYKHGEAPVCVTVEGRGHAAVIDVQDSGSGIPEDEHDSLFEPFQRGKGKQNVPGNGLGLALVKKVVDAHYGTIKIIRDASATISVSLPTRHAALINRD